MLTQVFLLFVVLVAIAVQAAPTDHFLSPEKATNIESNPLKTYLQAAGSGGTTTDTGIDAYVVTIVDATHIQIDFDASGQTYYYFMVKDASGSVPTVPSPTGVRNYEDIHVGEGFLNSGDADGPASIIIEVTDSDVISVYAAAVYDSILYPTEDVAAQTVVENFVLPPDVQISAIGQLDDVGSYELQLSTTADGSYQVFTYQCCDLVLRGAVKCPADANVEATCTPATALGYTPIGDVYNVTAGDYTVAGVADLDATATPYSGYISINVVFTQAATGEVFYFQEVVTLFDDVAPIWLSAPVVESASGDSITIAASVDDQVTFYTVATAVGAVAPTADEIIAAGNTGTTVSGLTDNTEYVVYIVPVSDLSGQGPVESVTTFTADTTAPIVEVFTAGTVTRDSCQITVQCNEECFMDGLLTSGAPATFGDIIGSYNTDALLHNTASDNTVSFDLIDLEPETTYFLSVVTYDGVNNTDFTVSVVEFTTDPLVIWNTEVYSIVNDVTVNGSVNLAGEATLEVTPTTGVLVQAPVAVDPSAIGACCASLTFYGGEEGKQYTVSLVTSAWTVLGATSDCAALLADQCINADWDINGDDGSVAATGVTATVTDGKLVFDVSADVAAMIDGGDNFGWYLESHANGTFSSSEGPNGPELSMTYQDDIETGQQAIEPCCEEETTVLTCDVGVININWASWGRHNDFQCPFRDTPGHRATMNVNCHSESSLAYVSSICNGEVTCSVLASSTTELTDPCRGTWKYLSAAYSCLTSVGDFCSGFTASESQAACTSSNAGPVYTCVDGFSGDACEINDKEACLPLVLHLSFDGEDASDVSCNENVGTDFNEPTYTAGVTGRAAVYGEIDEQYSHVADAEVLQLSSEFSACLWVNAEEEVSNGHTSVVLSQGVMGGAGSAGRQGFGIYLNKDNKYQTGARVSVRFERAQGRQSLEQAFTMDGNWHFVCAVFSEAKQSFYVDGTVVTEDRKGSHGPVTASTEGIFVGTDFEASKYQFEGAIDEVKIYNVALTQDEVSVVFSGDGGLLPTTGFFQADNTVANEEDVDLVVLNAGASGCADGTREGFLEQDGIAACAGAWSVPGVATVDSYDRQCDGAQGQGCSVADVCEVGWHVCATAKEVLAKSDGLGCNGVSDFSGGFFVSRQSGNGNINMNSEGTNDVFGCGEGASIGSANEARGLNAFSHNNCKHIDGSWACNGDGRGLDEALTITHDSDFGGALCCRDDRQTNCGQQKSSHKQVEVKVRKSTGKSHTDDEDAKAIGQAIESEVNKKSNKSKGKHCKVRAVRKRSGSSNKSHQSKRSRGGHRRRLLQTTADPQYTYVVYEVVPGATSTGDELANIQSVISSSDSELNTDFVGIEGYSELHSCDDGTMQSSCDDVVLRETVELPAGSVGAGYGESETATLGNSSDIVNAVIVTASVFVLLIVSGFAYRAHTAKSVDAEFDAKIMNSTQQASDVEMSAKGKEQDTYWVFNKQTDGQENVRVVV